MAHQQVRHQLRIRSERVKGGDPIDDVQDQLGHPVQISLMPVSDLPVEPDIEKPPYDREHDRGGEGEQAD